MLVEVMMIGKVETSIATYTHYFCINSNTASLVGIAGIPPRFCTHNPATAFPKTAHFLISSHSCLLYTSPSPRDTR